MLKLEAQIPAVNFVVFWMLKFGAQISALVFSFGGLLKFFQCWNSWPGFLPRLALLAGRRWGGLEGPWIEKACQASKASKDSIRLLRRSLIASCAQSTSSGPKLLWRVKASVRTCTHMHMHTHMFINYVLEGDRRSLPFSAKCSKASICTGTHMHMHTHTHFVTHTFFN